MSKEDNSKQYLAPIIEAEQGLAELIAGIPRISDLVPPERQTGAIPVFAVSSESAKVFLNKNIQRGLKQTVEVAFVRSLNEGTVQASGEDVFIDCLFRVTVSAPAILSDNAPLHTTSVATLIIKTLHGNALSYPFAEDIPILAQSISREETTDERFLTSVDFSARVRLF